MISPIRVIIVDDHQLFRQSLKVMVSKWDGIEIVGDTGHWKEAIAMAEAKKPSVVVLDISMPGMGGLELVPKIRKCAPDAKIMILSMYDDSNHVYRAFRLGCRGFVLKSDSADELEQAIRNVARNKMVLSPTVSAVFINKIITKSQEEDKTTCAKLTEREQEIAQMLKERRTTKQIGKDLFISPKTVRVHLTNIMRKLQCETREDLVFRLDEIIG